MTRTPGVIVVLLIACVAGLAFPVHGQTPLVSDPYQSLTVGEKGILFAKRNISPPTLAGSAVKAGIDQYQDSPEEWGQGMAGYGRRYGSKAASRAAKNVIGFLVAAPLRQDPRYFYSGATGIGPRSRHAVVTTFLTRTDNDARTLSVWRLAGIYGSSFISNTWRPKQYTQLSDSLVRGTVSLGEDVAVNLFKEFWPDIRRIVFRH